MSQRCQKATFAIEHRDWKLVGIDVGDDRLVGSGAKMFSEIRNEAVAAELRRQTHY
jgi:hypothetical protein